MPALHIVPARRGIAHDANYDDAGEAAGGLHLARSRRWWLARWILGFVGYPIGGLLAITLVGGADSTTAAMAAGAIAGAVIGAAQGLAERRLPLVDWMVASGVGLAAGLSIGASLVDFRTSALALAAQGAISGTAVGLAQAVVLISRTATSRAVCAAWPLVLGPAWALGWVITTGVGVDVARHYAVFGATGAVVVTAITARLMLEVEPGAPADRQRLRRDSPR